MPSRDSFGDGTAGSISARIPRPPLLSVLVPNCIGFEVAYRWCVAPTIVSAVSPYLAQITSAPRCGAFARFFELSDGHSREKLKHSTASSPCFNRFPQAGHSPGEDRTWLSFTIIGRLHRWTLLAGSEFLTWAADAALRAVDEALHAGYSLRWIGHDAAWHIDFADVDPQIVPGYNLSLVWDLHGVASSPSALAS